MFSASALPAGTGAWVSGPGGCGHISPEREIVHSDDDMRWGVPHVLRCVVVLVWAWGAQVSCVPGHVFGGVVVDFCASQLGFGASLERQDNHPEQLISQDGILVTNLAECAVDREHHDRVEVDDDRERI